MTSNSPEQMRALADEFEGPDSGPETDSAVAAAFRAAADQLETVQAQHDKWADRVAAIERVADLAQDDEDGNGWVPIGPLLDALYPEKRGAL